VTDTAKKLADDNITILLSTFNGARFLQAQLDSFVIQSYQNWTIYWRDDGSSDDSVAIMRDFAARLGPARCIESPGSGPHLGASPSFLTLLSEVPGAAIVAFADQDDVWLPEKLQAAITRLAPAAGRPALYCARQYLVDQDLRGAKLSAMHDTSPGFPASLTQNIANGNTLVMTGAAARLVAAAGRPDGTVHDWWSYIVVSAAGGAIFFDETPTVYYRLHKNNLIGSARPLPARAVAAIQRGPAIFMTMMRRHADALADQASIMSPHARADLKIIRAALHGNIVARLRALLTTRLRRRTLLENLLFSYWFITNTPPPSLRLASAAPRHVEGLETTR
jgi:hypothetical protein